MVVEKIVESKAFNKAVEKTFEMVDTDNSGAIDKMELAMAMCHLHYKLCDTCPGTTKPPTNETVSTKMREVDMDESGSLDKEEFRNFALAWFANDSRIVLPRLVLSACITTILIPNSANLIHKFLPIFQPVPKFVFKILFGVGTYDYIFFSSFPCPVLLRV